MKILIDTNVIIDIQKSLRNGENRKELHDALSVFPQLDISGNEWETLGDQL